VTCPSKHFIILFIASHLKNIFFSLNQDLGKERSTLDENGTRIIFDDEFLTIPKTLILQSFHSANEDVLERQRKIDKVFIHSEFLKYK
jgi:hypothetical protein